MADMLMSACFSRLRCYCRAVHNSCFAYAVSVLDARKINNDESQRITVVSIASRVRSQSYGICARRQLANSVALRKGRMVTGHAHERRENCGQHPRLSLCQHVFVFLLQYISFIM